MRIVIEGCMHGELDKVYSTLLHMEKVENKKIDLLICCGDFQSVRNTEDLASLHVSPKYMRMGSFWKYYSGQALAPFPTIFIGGNHEASNYLWELYYGGWAAPNIYFMGFAGVVQFGNLRIAGLSGIYYKNKNNNNNKIVERYESGHHERYPYNPHDIISVYHTREYEVKKLMQITQPIDIFISHDWPRGIASYGNLEELLHVKPEPEFKHDVLNNRLGSPPAELLLHELKPKFWFSAHHHCKFAAMVQHGYKGPVTRFLALDKCLPKHNFLQAIDIIEDGPKVMGPPYEIHYDEEWLAITKKFNPVFPLTREPAKYELLQFDKTSIEEHREWVIDKLERRGTKKPFDFVQTAPPYCPIVSRSPSVSRSSDHSPSGIRNPQTDSLMEFLELQYVL